MRFYRWTHESGGAEPDQYTWYLSIKLVKHNEWDLMRGQYIGDWDPATVAYYEGQAERSDFPFTSPELPVYSPRLMEVMEKIGVEGIQYLPLRIMSEDRRNEIRGYHIANYLNVIDCLDRERSTYQVWTKENLLYWEDRPHMLGTFRDITKMILDAKRIPDLQIFRLWGWEMEVTVRSDLKRAIEAARITGCRFTEIQIV